MANVPLEKPTKPVLVHMFEDEWEIFKELVGERGASRRLRTLVSKDIDHMTREEVRAQQMAGLTEG